MARPQYYRQGTVTRSLSLAADADAALEANAKLQGMSRSQLVSELIMEALGLPAPEKVDDET